MTGAVSFVERIRTVRFSWVKVLPLAIGYAAAVVESVNLAMRGSLTWPAVGVTLVAAVLAGRRVGHVFAVAALFVAVIAVNAFLVTPTMVAVIILSYVWLFEVAVDHARRPAIGVSLIVGGALCITSAVAERSGVAAVTLVVYALWAAVVTAVGSAIQTQRLYVASVEDRANRAERTKEEAVLRHVAEERMRIARELHDVVAHHITAVSMQINVARARLRTSAPLADSVLGQAQDSARAVIAELQDILQILRETAADDIDPVVMSADVTDQLNDLMRPFALLEHPPTLTVTGHSDEMPPAVGLAVYRVVQEGLTNAYKHGVGGADVRVTCGPGSDVTVTVRNQVAPVTVSAFTSESDGGFGLIGMQERVRAAGGTLSIDRAGSSFTLHAEFRRARDSVVTGGLR